MSDESKIPPRPELRRRPPGSFSRPTEDGIDLEEARRLSQSPKRRRLGKQTIPSPRAEAPKHRRPGSFPRRGRSTGSFGAFLLDIARNSVLRIGRWLGAHSQFGQYRLDPLYGPRKWVYRFSGGYWNFGGSRSQRDARAKATIQRRFPRCYVFMSFSRGGGGVGKTITANSLAQTLDSVVPDAKTLLIDKHPLGSVGAVTGVRRDKHVACVQQGKPEEACFTFLEAYQKLGHLTSESAIRWRFPIMEGTGMYVLTYPEADRLDGDQLVEFIKLMKQYFSFIVVDSEPDDGQADTQAMLGIVDVVAVITKRRNENRIMQAANAVKLIRNTPSYSRGRDRVVLVINQVWFNPLHWWGTTRTVKMLNEALGEEYKGAVATLPSNFLVARGKMFYVFKRSPRFRRHALEMAALLVEKASESETEDAAASAESETLGSESTETEFQHTAFG
jgi:cellulose biosynthesis protein BcsQ